MYDVIIIGAGVTGAAAARELSRYRLCVCVLEREEDVCAGTSKANSALVHAGFDAAPGSLKARLNREGSRQMEELCGELDVPYIRNGAFVLAFGEKDREKLKVLLSQGEKNGVEGLKILSGEEVREMEPAVSADVTAALWAPTAAIVCPFELTIALAENAAENGVEFLFSTEVTGIHRIEGGYALDAGGRRLEARVVVNAAGVYADELHNMVCDKKYKITARRGEYCLLDKAAGTLVSHTLFQVPGPMGKGVLVTPTIHGNMLLGPTAADTQDKAAVRTTQEGLDAVTAACTRSVPGLPLKKVITSFAGLRAHEEGGDFVIGESDAEGFIDALGIESPGLSASPAIGRMICHIVRDKLTPEEKESFQPRRRGILRPGELPEKERQELIRKNPAYGHIVCRCEMVTEGEILDAIHRPLGAVSLDGVKRRVRAGMGRCQAGFCSPRVMELLARETGIHMSCVTKAGAGSELLSGKSREDAGDEK